MSLQRLSDKQKLNLCRKAWVAFVVSQNSSDVNEIKHYEEKINVKNIDNGPVFQNEVIYGEEDVFPVVTMIGCELSIRTSNIDPFQVFIALQKNDDSYFIIRSQNCNSAIYYFLVGQVNDVKFETKKEYNKSVSNKYKKK